MFMSSGSEKDRESEERENGFGANLNKLKRTPFRFRKFKNRLRRRKHRLCNSYSSSSSVGCFGKRVDGNAGGGGGGGGCLHCCKKGPTSGSPVESRTSDPNSADFTHESLRSLIETNDFYLKECNCHGIGDK